MAENRPHMKILLICLLSGMLFGCATATKMNEVSVGMTKAQVIEILGKPENTAAHDNIEVMRFHLRRAALEDYSESNIYFVKLRDGRVSSFGKMGDFDSTKEPSINVNVRQQ